MGRTGGVRELLYVFVSILNKPEEYGKIAQVRFLSSGNTGQ
jgi:hypothetical protein